MAPPCAPFALAVLDGSVPPSSVGSPSSMDHDRVYFIVKGEVAVHVRDPLVTFPAQEGPSSLASPSYASAGASALSLPSHRPKTSRGECLVSHCARGTWTLHCHFCLFCGLLFPPGPVFVD